MTDEPLVPPNDPSAERGVLGSILLDTAAPDDDGRVFDICAARGVTEDSFFDPRNRAIYSALLAMARATLPIDAITLNDRLRSSGMLEAAGGVGYIQNLIESTPTAAHAEYYIDIVRQKHLLRRLIQAARETERKCYSGEGSANADIILGEAETRFLQIGGEASEGIGWKKAVDLSLRSIEKSLDKGAGSFTGLSTGFRDLDITLQGMQPGAMIVVAARPSMGKTSLAMNIAECVALGQNINGVPMREENARPHPTLVFSLEMSTESLAARMLCGRAGVSSWRVQHGVMAKKERSDATSALFAAAGNLMDAPLYIDDSGALDISDLRARARRMKRSKGIELIVIDYLQLCNCREFSRQGRQIETSQISGQIKAMAKELKVPVIVLSQLTRGSEQRKDKREEPKLSDLRDSGAIEQDADVVLLLTRPERIPSHPEHEKKNLAIVNVAKNRNGPIGNVRMNFISDITRFGDRDRSEDDDSAVGAGMSPEDE